MNRHCAGPGPRGAMRGFSLIELMITVAIVGIIATIAIPSYRSYMLKANRTDAMQALTFAQQVLERCYSQNFSYLDVANDCPASANIIANTPRNDYAITVPTWNATNYVIQATAIGPQTSDTACATFTVTNANQQGAQNSVAANNTPTCWSQN